MSEPLSDLDLIELSGRAWQVVDPDGEHEADEQTWSALLQPAGPPPATIANLQAHVGQIVGAAHPPAAAAPVQAVAAIMVFLARHPERHDLGEALLADAVREAYGEDVPIDLARWLVGRRRAPEAHRRRHGAAQPRRPDTRPTSEVES